MSQLTADVGRCNNNISGGVADGKRIHIEGLHWEGINCHMFINHHAGGCGGKLNKRWTGLGGRRRALAYARFLGPKTVLA